MNFAEALKNEKIQNVMVPRGICVAKTDSYGAVIAKLQAEEKFCAVVLNGNKVAGIFTERDALKRGLLQNTSPQTPIEKLMTPDPDMIDTEDSLAAAIRMMHEGKHRHLPVINKQQEFLGLISVRDIVFYLSENYPHDVFNLPPDPHKFSNAAEGA